MNATRKGYRALPIYFLRAGMIIQSDVYSWDKRHLLLRSGMTLSEGIVQKLKMLNGGSEAVLVTENTYNVIMGKEMMEMDGFRQAEVKKLEEETGYAGIKTETVQLLDNIAQTGTVNQDSLQAVSGNLSERIESTNQSTILSLINALAPVDEYLQRHCINVSMLNGLFGKWLGLSEEEVDKLILIGLVHDCGKAESPPAILNAPRKLSMVEFEVIKCHTLHSYDLLGEFPEYIRMAARCHHEKLNGKGYPHKLSGEDIPFEARITAITDVYDAMVSQRSYKDSRSPFKVMSMLNRLSGTELDSQLVSVFNKNIPKELIGKQVMLSDGTVGTVSSVDPGDIEYPTVILNNKELKTDRKLHCMSMY